MKTAIRQLTLDDVRFSVIKLTKCADVVRIRCSLKDTEFVSVTRTINFEIWESKKNQHQAELLVLMQSRFEELYGVLAKYFD